MARTRPVCLFPAAREIFSLALEGEGFAPWICEGLEGPRPWPQQYPQWDGPSKSLGAKGEGVTGGSVPPHPVRQDDLLGPALLG
jgi:hypothetical protein